MEKTIGWSADGIESPPNLIAPHPQPPLGSERERDSFSGHRTYESLIALEPKVIQVLLTDIQSPLPRIRTRAVRLYNQLAER